MAGFALLLAALSFVLVERPIRRIQVVVRRPALGLGCGAALVGICIGVAALSGPVFASLRAGVAVAAPALDASHPLTAAQLARDLRAGARTMKVPANLSPPLTSASRAQPFIINNGCSLQHTGVKSKPCVYGDRQSHISVAVFGDSHAAGWFPALNIISKQQHWRLVDLTKASCPPAEVSVTRHGVPYPNCTKWRRTAMKQIAAMHPALVVITTSRYVGGAAPLRGVPTGHGNTWLNGMAAIFAFLHRSAKHVIFISDVPRLKQSAPDCVSGHPSDVRSCDTPRRTAVYDPRVKADELTLAKREHVDSIDPIPWFCTPTTCPVIVGNIIMYRDDAHMVPAWSRFIAPVLASSILPVMRPSPAPAPTH
jgi:SGNH domain (fused to AT3 domains)